MRAHCTNVVRLLLEPRFVIRPLCSVSFELDTRGTNPKYAANLFSVANSFTSPITDNKKAADFFPILQFLLSNPHIFLFVSTMIYNHFYNQSTS